MDIKAEREDRSGALPGSYSCRVCGHVEADVISDGVKDWEYGVAGEWSLMRCGACDVVQLHPFPDLETLKRAYDVDYHGYSQSGEKGAVYAFLYNLHNIMFERAMRRELSANARILDVGCGSGELLSRLRNVGASVLDGIDFSERAVALARSKGINVFHGVFSEFPAEPATYDAIFMNNYLEHTLDPVAELRRARELLKSSGVLIGEVPNFDALDRRIFGRYWGGNHAPRHTFHFNRSTLSKLLQRTDFREVRFSYSFNSSHAALSVQNFLCRHKWDDLGAAPLKHGRAPYYNLLLLMLAFPHALTMPFGFAGLVDFVAVA